MLWGKMPLLSIVVFTVTVANKGKILDLESITPKDSAFKHDLTTSHIVLIHFHNMTEKQT